MVFNREVLTVYWFVIITKYSKGAVLFKQQNFKIGTHVFANDNEKKQHVRTSTKLGVV